MDSPHSRASASSHSPAHHHTSTHSPRPAPIVRGGPTDAAPHGAAREVGGRTPASASGTPSAPDAVLFSQLNLCAPVLRALEEEGYSVPTPIQARAIPPALEGRDLLGCAQTGTGKTAAFALPILHRLLSGKPDMTRRGAVLPRTLVLSPTRELATQIMESFDAYGRHTGLEWTVIFGGTSQGKQVRALQSGVDILVATPGRLIDLMEQGYVDLSAVEILVLDEADRMLDMGFIKPIRTIVSRIVKPRQTMLFSATMPKEIVRLAEDLLKQPVRVSVTPVSSAAPLIEQRMYLVPKRSKPAMLEHLLHEESVDRAVVFTKTKHGADRLCRHLVRGGIPAVAIHGNKAQNQRERALHAFRTGRNRVLVATDVAARGLDVDGITHVFNFDLPMEPEAYVHRIGRTGRAGAKGVAISFCDAEERGLMRDIERVTGKRFTPIAQLPDLPLPEAESFERSHEERGGTHWKTDRPHAARDGWSNGGPANRDATHTTQPAHHKPRPHGAGPANSGHAPSGHANSGHANSGHPKTRPSDAGHPNSKGPGTTAPTWRPRGPKPQGSGHAGSGHGGTGHRNSGTSGSATRGSGHAGRSTGRPGGFKNDGRSGRPSGGRPSGGHHRPR